MTGPRFCGALAALALAGCTIATRPAPLAPAIPPAWPAGPAYGAMPMPPATVTDHQRVFRDPRLQSLIARALAHNQDLRIAVANVAAARAQYRVQRAGQSPGVDASAGASLGDREGYDAGVAVSAFELDLFGRVASLSRAARAEYLATGHAARAVRTSLIAEVASAYLALAADRSLLAIAADTTRSGERSVALADARRSGGIAPRSDVRRAQTILAQAQSDRAELTTAVAQGRNALELLVGGPVTDVNLPPSMEAVADAVADVPAGQDSAILLERPDVMEAEQRLRAADARIDAARAAFFPRISLSALAGLSATALSALFSGGSLGLSAGASASLPIFDGGARRGNLVFAQAQRAASVAGYQQTVRQAFREAADALARRGTIGSQLAAQTALVEAARDTLALEEARYREGIVPYLNILDAQRTLYQARRSLTATQLVQQNLRVTLYRVLGGDRPGEGGVP